jgi:hypothetical protein
VTIGVVSVPVTVGSTDVEGVRIEYSPGAQISGQIRFEGERPAKSGPFSVFITADGRSGCGNVVKPDLTFQCSRMEANRYQVQVLEGEPHHFYVKSMRSGGRCSGQRSCWSRRKLFGSGGTCIAGR